MEKSRNSSNNIIDLNVFTRAPAETFEQNSYNQFAVIQSTESTKETKQNRSQHSDFLQGLLNIFILLDFCFLFFRFKVYIF